MKCFTHQEAEATAVCIHCGQALCAGCMQKSKSGRVVCSAGCASALERAERVIHGLFERNIKGARSTGIFATVAGFMLMGFGLHELSRGMWELFAYCELFGLAIAGVGARFVQIAKKRAQEMNGR